jgi:hypothetical protein
MPDEVAEKAVSYCDALAGVSITNVIRAVCEEPCKCRFVLPCKRCECLHAFIAACEATSELRDRLKERNLL